MHSHIQIPDSVLTHFRDELDPQKKVWYLDLPSGEIRKKSSKKLGTFPNYYSKTVEEFWSQYLESPLGQLNKKVRTFCAGSETTLTLTSDDQIIAKRYIKAAAIRSGAAYSEMLKNSATVNACSVQENHDDLSLLGMALKGQLDQLIDDMAVTVLVNRSNRHLVVPRNCYYCMSYNKKELIVAPIFPCGALLLLPIEQVRKYENKYYAVSCEAEFIEALNLRALWFEYMFNGAFVASDRREELVLLQTYRQKNLEKLMELRGRLQK